VGGQKELDVTEALLLLDHDNCPFTRIPLHGVIERWLATLPRTDTRAVRELLVRAYGGWWHGDLSSNSRVSAMQLYTAQCPALIRQGTDYWRVRFEFADHLLWREGQVDPRIENTFVLRPAPQLFSPKAPASPCTETNCESQRVRLWLLKRRGCTRPACPRTFSEMWYRPEQKQVDVHLVVDLLTATLKTKSSINVAVASDDLDFLPALLAAVTHSTSAFSITHIRFTARAMYLDDCLRRLGMRILQASSENRPHGPH
jgi:hypothetical protein